MNINLYFRELSRNKKGLIIWSLTIAGLIIMVMAFYPSISEEAEIYEKMIESMPKAFSAMLGLNDLSMTDIFGYHAIEGYLMITLMGSIFVMILSSGILSKEEGDKTVEFLLSKPITRREVVTSKLMCYITNILIFNIILSIVLFTSFRMVSKESFSMRTFTLICLAPLFLQLTYSAIGFLMSVFITKSKKVLPLALGVVLVTYFLGLFSELSDKMNFLKYFSPFKYFEAKDIILNNQIDIKSIIFMISVNVICICLAYIVYEKKDITV